MTVRVSVPGAGRLATRLERLQRQVEDALKAALAEGAEDLREEARALLDQAGAGAPSAPGAPPHRQSGALRDSLRVEVTPGGLSARVGSALDYAAHLEFGTRDMAPRPFLLPALERAKPRLRARLGAALGQALGKAARGSSAAASSDTGADDR